MKKALVILTVAAGLRLHSLPWYRSCPTRRTIGNGRDTWPPDISITRPPSRISFAQGPPVGGANFVGRATRRHRRGLVGCLAAVALARIVSRALASDAHGDGDIGHAVGGYRSRAGYARCPAWPARPSCLGTRSCLEECRNVTDLVVWAGGRVAPSGWWWVLVGVMLGRDFLSEYPAVFLPAGVALGAPTLRASRAIPHAEAHIVACVIAVVFLSARRTVERRPRVGVVCLSARHGLGPSRIGRESRSAVAGRATGSGAPILFALLVRQSCIASAARREPAFLLATSARSSGGSSPQARSAPVSPNWPALALLPAIVSCSAVQRPGPAWLWWELAGVVLAAAVVLALSVHAVHPWLPFTATPDPFAQAYGWDDLARAVARDTIAVAAGRYASWLAADRYQEASELAWHLRGHPSLLARTGEPAQRVDFWPTAADSVRLGDSMTVVLDDIAVCPRRFVGSRLILAWSFAETRSICTGDRVDVVAQRRIWHFLNLTVPCPRLLGRPFMTHRSRRSRRFHRDASRSFHTRVVRLLTHPQCERQVRA